MKQHVVWNDGCAGQFKSARAWYFMGRYHNYIASEQLLGGCQMSYNYFATGHGKREDLSPKNIGLSRLIRK
jgi:hypothetical protein